MYRTSQNLRSQDASWLARMQQFSPCQMWGMNVCASVLGCGSVLTYTHFARERYMSDDDPVSRLKSWHCLWTAPHSQQRSPQTAAVVMLLLAVQLKRALSPTFLDLWLDHSDWAIVEQRINSFEDCLQSHSCPVWWLQHTVECRLHTVDATRRS